MRNVKVYTVWMRIYDWFYTIDNGGYRAPIAKRFLEEQNAKDFIEDYNANPWMYGNAGEHVPIREDYYRARIELEETDAVEIDGKYYLMRELAAEDEE